MGGCGGEEHDVAGHCQGGGDDDEDGAAVEFPGEEVEEDGEEGADDVGGDCVELLGDYRVVGVDCCDDCGGELGRVR